MKILLIIVAAIIALIVAVVLSAFAFVHVAMHGGIKGFFLSLKPRPTLERADIKERRAKVRAKIESAFAHIMDTSDFIAFETASQDVCYGGIHQQLTVEDFAHRCTLRLTRFYGFDDPFRDKMIEFEHRVLSEGWDRGQTFRVKELGSMESYMKNYYDVRHLRNNPSLAVDFVARPAGYHSDTAQLQMQFAWAERESKRNGVGVGSLNYVQQRYYYTVQFFEQLSVRDGNEILEQVTRDHKYILAVAIWGHYFQH